MPIELPRSLATQMWHLALEAPDTTYGVFEQDQDQNLYRIQPCQCTRATPNAWATTHVVDSAQAPWAYYQTFQQPVPLPSAACWQGLPRGCLLIALMLDTKGLLDMQAFQWEAQGVRVVALSLSPEP